MELPDSEPQPANEEREVMFSYVSTATFMGARHQPCRHMTSLCPDRCGHATNVYSFQLDSLAVTKNEASSHARWVTPETEGGTHMTGESDLKQYLDLAKSLSPGTKVNLEWSHDYVTVGGCSGPDRPITKLALATTAPDASDAGGSGLWEGAEALAQQREMAEQWRRERTAAQEHRRQVELATQQLQEDSAELERTLSQIAAIEASKPGPPAGAVVAGPQISERREATAAAGRDRRAELLAARRAAAAGGGDGRGGGAGAGGGGDGRFPAHWGDPPRMQTRDLRPLPGGYGMGSGTLRSWIQQKMAEDAAAGR